MTDTEVDDLEGGGKGDPASVRLQFDASILARLGEELIPDSDQGLLELVRNAYDAGAKRCTIELLNAERAGGTIVIEDNGVGMTTQDLTHGFLVLGRSRKTQRQHGRLMVGEKGLGRLAALRLGRRVTVETRPRGLGVKHTLELDWDRFSSAKVVEDVELVIATTGLGRSESSHGTTITIHDLREPMPAPKQESLARSLLLLSDPFGSDLGFEASLKSQAFQDLSKMIRAEYLGAAEYRLTARVNDHGQASAELRHHTGRLLASATHAELRRDLRSSVPEMLPYACPPAEFEMYVFLLGGKSESSNVRLRQLGVRKVSTWVKAVGGIHLYHRGLRVRPFGDPGYDWLGLNVRRVQSPEDRPGTNTTVGRVLVNDEDDLLVPKTDRVGFVENEAFQELHDFAYDATEFMARWRIAQSRRQRESRRERERTEVDDASERLAQAVGKLPPAQRAPVAEAVRTLTVATRKRDEGRVADIQLYRTMSTLGAATSVFAHETDKPTERLLSLLKVLRRRVKRAVGDESSLLEPLDELDRVAAGLRALTQMPLRLLKANRRRIASTGVGASAQEVLETFDYFLRSNTVSVETTFAENDRVLAAPAALEVIVANLLVNAVAALTNDSRSSQQRTVSVATTLDNGMVTLEFSDNGPGFQGITVERVWELGETRREGGSGLGLTIVRDTVKDLGGTATAVSPGVMGGATFIIQIPAARSAR
jgi:signal transduction histidine kinase